jgi:hypothetical protein
MDLDLLPDMGRMTGRLPLDGTPAPGTEAVVARLEAVLAKDPNHPGQTTRGRHHPVHDGGLKGWHLQLLQLPARSGRTRSGRAPPGQSSSQRSSNRKPL